MTMGIGGGILKRSTSHRIVCITRDDALCDSIDGTGLRTCHLT